MAVAKSLSLLILFVTIISFAAAAQAANFNITNNCSYTVWAAAVPGGGARLNPGEWWNISMANGTSDGRIWGRTNCSFDGAGRGKCLTGDCEGVLECNKTGTPPNTVVELALNQYNNLDFYDISVVEGFNVPLKLSSSYNCSSVECADGDIIRECPRQLQVPGGCNNPCTVFNTTEYCCSSGVDGCGPTDYSKFFKDRCPDAYSYPMDDATSTFICKGGSDYTLLFCP